jgi:hypothetical protein
VHERAIESSEQRPGWIEAAARLARVLLRSPRIKAALRAALSHLDPQYSETLVDALLRTDSEVPLAIVNALPDAANIAIGGLHALARAGRRLPAPALATAAADLTLRLQLRALGEAIGYLAASAVELRRTGIGTERGAREIAIGMAATLREEGLEPVSAIGGLALATLDGALAELERSLEESPDAVLRLAELGADLADVLARRRAAVEALAPLVRPLLAAWDQAQPAAGEQIEEPS